MEIQPLYSAFDKTPAEPPAAAPALTPEETKQGRKFVRLVRRTKPARRIAEKLLTGGSLSPEDAASLMQVMEKPSGFRWREARLAAWALGFVPADAPQQREIAWALGKRLGSYHWPDEAKIALTRMGLIATPLFAWFAYLFIANNASLNLFWTLFWPLLLAVCTAALPVLIIRHVWDDLTYSLTRCAAAKSLARLRLPDSVAPLVSATNYQPDFVANVQNWRKIRRIAREGLPEAISTLRPEHYLQLEPTIVPNLTLLINDREEAMALLALDALGKVGDGRAVIPVQRLLAKHASPRRREIANAILPLLHYRQQQENSYTHLLRASSAPVGPETLLRAASGKPDDAPETLLRASDLDSPAS